MINKTLRSLCLSLVLGSLALSSFSVASADGPVIIGPDHREGSDELWDCGSFKIIDNWVLDITTRLFIDEAGNRERVITTLQGIDTFTNSETGKAYSGSFHNTFAANFQGDGRGYVQTGVIYRLTLPGAGAVVLDVGAIVYRPAAGVAMVVGPKTILEGDFDGLCAVLT